MNFTLVNMELKPRTLMNKCILFLIAVLTTACSTFVDETTEDVEDEVCCITDFTILLSEDMPAPPAYVYTVRNLDLILPTLERDSVAKIYFMDTDVDRNFNWSGSFRLYENDTTDAVQLSYWSVKALPFGKGERDSYVEKIKSDVKIRVVLVDGSEHEILVCQ